MRKTLGWLVLGAGVAGLGWYGRGNDARDMEADILARAQNTAVMATLKHNADLQVSGRDIAVTGLADTQAEKDAVTAALTGVKGQRVVRNDMRVLPQADPYEIRVTKGVDGFSAAGAVTSEALRAELASGPLAGASSGLMLSGGAPEGWGDVALRGANALDALDTGDMVLTDRVLTVSGKAMDADAKQAMLAAIGTLPDGYSLADDVSLLDDGTPPAFTLSYDAGSGASITGKLPRDFGADDIGSALGLETVNSAQTTRSTKFDAAEGQGDQIARLAPWLTSVETLDYSRAADGAESVDARVAPSVNASLVRDALGVSFGDAAITVETATMPEPGSSRVNAATGQTEILRGAFWVPVYDFEVSADRCASGANDALQMNRINFLSGSSDLDAQSTRAISVLAGVLDRCVSGSELAIEIGGHTDSSGDASANQTLSEARAQVVMAELVARGLPDNAMRATGYGSDQPIADNGTEEGRAQNRRTTISFSAR